MKFRRFGFFRSYFTTIKWQKSQHITLTVAKVPIYALLGTEKKVNILIFEDLVYFHKKSSFISYSSLINLLLSVALKI